MLAAFSFLFATATTVLGHGYVQEVVTSSGTYTGYLPYSDPYTSPAPERIIRKIPGKSKISHSLLVILLTFARRQRPSGGCHFDRCSMQWLHCWRFGWFYPSAGCCSCCCRHKCRPVSCYLTIHAYSHLTIVSFRNWTTWPDSHVGPVITYMARAPSDVTSWNPGTEYDLLDGVTLDRYWFKDCVALSGSRLLNRVLKMASGQPRTFSPVRTTAYIPSPSRLLSRLASILFGGSR